MSVPKGEGIEQRVTKVSMVTGLSVALSVLFQFTAVPICLHYWGITTYGAWLALFATFTLLRTLDAGYVNYVGNKLNLVYHSDHRDLRTTLGSALWGSAALGAFQLIILSALFATGAMRIIVEGHHGTGMTHDMETAFAILIASWVLTGTYLGIVHRFLIPVGMMYEAAWWSLAYQVSQFIALIGAAVLGFTLLQASILFALIQAAVYLASAVYIKSKLPSFYPWWTGGNWSLGITDLFRSLPLTVSGVLQQAGNSGLVIVVSAVIGPAIVPALTTVRTMSNLWITGINILTTPLLPDVVRFYATRDTRSLISIHQAHWLLVGAASNLSILAAYPFIEPLYAAWTDNRLPLNKPLLCLLLATASITGMSALITTFFSGINHSRFALVSAVARGGLALCLGVWLVPTFGLAGVGVTVLLVEAVVLVVSLHWLFKTELSQISGEAPELSLSWAWISSGCVVTYMVIESFSLAVSRPSYWAAIIGVLSACAMAWRRLNPELKGRFRSLLLSASGIRPKYDRDTALSVIRTQ